MNTIRVDLETEDWVWLCEMLAAIRRYDESDLMLNEDAQRAESALRAFEEAV